MNFAQYVNANPGLFANGVRQPAQQMGQYNGVAPGPRMVQNQQGAEELRTMPPAFQQALLKSTNPASVPNFGLGEMNTARSAPPEALNVLAALIQQAIQPTQQAQRPALRANAPSMVRNFGLG